VQDDLFKEVYYDDYNKWFALCSTFIFRLFNLFFGLGVKSAPSSRNLCSQNWVLDRRWQGYFFFRVYALTSVFC